MKKDKNFLIFLLLLALLIILVWIGIYYVQYRNGLSQLEEERYHNMLYLNLLEQAIINNIFSTEKIEDLFYEKLSETVEIISELDNISNEDLNKYLNILQLDEISIVDTENKIVNSSYRRDEYEYQLELLELQEGESVILSLPAVSDPRVNVKMYVSRKKDLYFLCSVAESRIRQFVKDISLNALIDFATKTYQESSTGSAGDIHIKYIVIQDTLGILAATDNVQTISRIENDELLQEVIKSQQIKSRFITFAGQEINETILPFQLDNYDFGVIRMGTHLARIQKAATRRKIVIIMFSFILAVFLFLEYLVYRYFRKYKASMRNLNLAERFKEIAALGGEVAHEIKNPLNALNMILQRLRSEFHVTEDEDDFNNMLAISSKELKRLNSIIEKFLNYSRLEDLQLEEIRILDLITSVAGLFKEAAFARGIKISVFCSPGLYFKLDQDRIKQVLINLVKNSLEAISKEDQQGEIELIVLSEKKRLVIRVKDNGAGINREQIDRVWDLYYTTKKDGSGIGLSFSRKIVEAHNGFMKISSGEEGTEVMLNLPQPDKE